MPIYLQETQLKNGKTAKKLVRMPSWSLYWRIQQLKDRDDKKFITFQKNSKGKVSSISMKDKYGNSVVNTLMNTPKRIKKEKKKKPVDKGSNTNSYQNKNSKNYKGNYSNK